MSKKVYLRNDPSGGYDEPEKEYGKILVFTPEELKALFDLLCQTAIEMDDDGREGAFEASPLQAVYDKVDEAMEEKL